MLQGLNQRLKNMHLMWISVDQRALNPRHQACDLRRATARRDGHGVRTSGEPTLDNIGRGFASSAFDLGNAGLAKVKLLCKLGLRFACFEPCYFEFWCEKFGHDWL